MKNKVLFFVFSSILVFLFSSCAYTYKSTASSVRVLDVQHDMLMADLEVGTSHISATVTVENTKRHKVNTKHIIDNAIYEALKNADADALIGLQYTTTYGTYSNSAKDNTTTTVTVSGYPVYFKNFRPVPVTVTKNEFDVKELKNDTPYIIVEKDDTGNQKGYRVITTTKTKHQSVIPIDNTTLEKIVLLGNEKVPRLTKKTAEMTSLNDNV